MSKYFYLALSLVIFQLNCFQLLHSIEGNRFKNFDKNVKIEKSAKKIYPFANDPIDVVIVAHPKDTSTLNLCIEGIKRNCDAVRRVIVVSASCLTTKAEWFNEADYPFTKHDISLRIGRGDEKRTKLFLALHGRKRGIGWYYQQLLKLYAPYVIPDISSNVLVIDADTIFLNPVNFLTDSHAGLFATATKIKDRYINHAKRLVPGYKRANPRFFSVCHHMLFQKPIMDDLFNLVEKHHGKAFWEAFCDCVDLNEGGASEYEIYYSFAFSMTNQVKIRQLKFANTPYLNQIENYRKKGYHFASFHSYMRDRLNAK